MAATLSGIVQGLRLVEGTVSEGKRQGEKWEFLSLEPTSWMNGVCAVLPSLMMIRKVMISTNELSHW